jgi:hypothetical protein
MLRLCSAEPLSANVADACCVLIDDDDSPLYHGPHSSSFMSAIASNLSASKNMSFDAAASVEKLQAASCVCATLSEALTSTATKEYFLSSRGKASRGGLYFLLDVALLPISKLVDDGNDLPGLAQSTLRFWRICSLTHRTLSGERYSARQRSLSSLSPRIHRSSHVSSAMRAVPCNRLSSMPRVRARMMESRAADSLLQRCSAAWYAHVLWTARVRRSGPSGSRR